MKNRRESWDPFTFQITKRFFFLQLGLGEGAGRSRISSYSPGNMVTWQTVTALYTLSERTATNKQNKNSKLYEKKIHFLPTTCSGEENTALNRFLEGKRNEEGMYFRTEFRHPMTLHQVCYSALCSPTTVFTYSRHLLSFVNGVTEDIWLNAWDIQNPPLNLSSRSSWGTTGAEQSRLILWFQGGGENIQSMQCIRRQVISNIHVTDLAINILSYLHCQLKPFQGNF